MSRGGVAYEGIAAEFATFKAASALQSTFASGSYAAVEGKSCTLTGDSEAGFGSDGDPLLGRIDRYEQDGHVTVQIGGFTEMPGVSGSLPSARDILVVDGAGAVKASTGATGTARAISIDSANNNVMVFIA